MGNFLNIFLAFPIVYNFAVLVSFVFFGKYGILLVPGQNLFFTLQWHSNETLH